MNALFQFIQNARILIMDEPADVRSLEALLKDFGPANFRSTNDPQQAVAICQEFQPDLVLVDLAMPHIDGLGVMEQIRSTLPPDCFLPIIVLTEDLTPEMKKRALSHGAKDFVLKPVDADELSLCIRNLLETRFLHLGLEQHSRDLEARVADRTRELEQTVRELRATQKQIVYQERLKAFAAMAGGVAHDFNNSLTIMMGFCDLLLDTNGLDDREDARRSIGTILQATQDAAKMVERLRSFYRPKEIHDIHLRVKVADLVRQAVEVAQPKWKNLARGTGSYIAVTTDVPEDLNVRGNARELRELLVNLMFNSVDAMPNGGRLSLRARGSDKEVVIEVADTGVGMSDEIRQRCLEPFFTTRGERGAGLGLAVVFGIVRRHEGILDIVSEPKKGTTFTIRLLREHIPAPVVRQNPPSNLPALRILFADDDVAIRKIVPMCLEKAGHTVTVACDGSEALELYAPGKYDVVLTDLAMPKLSGERLARAIKEQSSDQPIIVLTGYADTLLKSGPKPSFIDLLLNKPITNAELSSALAKVVPEVNSRRRFA